MKQKPKPLNLSFRTSLAALVVGAAVLGASGCASNIESRGSEIKPETVSAIEPGKHGREDVISLLGSPSSTTEFDGETWYYIYEKTESVAFLEPEVIERSVIAITFDASGRVSAVNSTGLEQAQKVEPSERETPTAGNKMSFFEQMISNIGRFNK